MNNRLSVYLEQEVLSASPMQLVHLVYQGAISSLRDARRYLMNGDVPARCRAISKACDLISELKSSLDQEAGGEVAVRLEALYGYMLCRLLDANLKQEDEPLAEVLGLLATLDEAWKELAEERKPEPLPAAAKNHFAMGAMSDGFDAAPANVWSL